MLVCLDFLSGRTWWFKYSTLGCCFHLYPIRAPCRLVYAILWVLMLISSCNFRFLFGIYKYPYAQCHTCIVHTTFEVWNQNFAQCCAALCIIVWSRWFSEYDVHSEPLNNQASSADSGEPRTTSISLACRGMLTLKHYNIITYRVYQ